MENRPSAVTAPAARSENQALNVMRTLAALAVAVGHARRYIVVPRFDAHHTSPVDTVLYAVTAFGHTGVLVFFVLSGYLVGGSVIRSPRTRPFTWPPYLLRRLVRLWLVLVPAVALTVVLDLVGRTVVKGPYYGPGSHAVRNSSLDVILGNLFFLQGNLVTALGTNRALWSLGYEFAYYLLFPALVLALAARTPVLRRVVAILVAVLVAVLSGTHVLLLFLVWLLGVLVAWRGRQVAAAMRRVRHLAALRLLLLLALGVAMIGTEFQHANQNHVSILTAALIATLLDDYVPRRGPVRTVYLAASRFAHSSYTLYATHLPVIVLVAALTQPHGRAQPTPLRWLFVLLVTAGTVVFAAGLARLTEHNTNTVTRRLGQRVKIG
jgi:peptidoglycan/LPS O-acetylase OafA/YrhL